MSDDEEYNAETNYGIDDAYATSFKNRTDSDEDNIESPLKENEYKPLNIDNFSLPKYDKNPKINDIFNKDSSKKNQHEGNLEDLLDLINDEEEMMNEQEQENNSEKNDGGLDDLLNLMNSDDDSEKHEEESSQRKKVLIKKDKKEPKVSSFKTAENVDSPKTKSSITITKCHPKVQKEPSVDEEIFTEKNTNLRLIKTPFKNEIEMNMRVMSDSGRFFKLSDVNRRACELKESGGNIKWYTVFVMGSKTETKSSAKGNNYVIWRIFDPANLDKQQEVSLFLFGAAYKTHWKSSEFEAFALVNPDILDNKTPGGCGSGQSIGSNTYFNHTSGSGRKPGPYHTPGGWNNFATKKIDQTLNNKLTLSVKSDFQLIPLGIAKDITNCQSNTTANPETKKASERCKNIVNLQDVPFCMYHIKQLEKKDPTKKLTESKYSMNKPTNRFGTNSLFKSTITPDVQFAKSVASPINFGFVEKDDGARFVPNGRISQAAKKVSEIDTRKKVVKEMKSEIIKSLTTSISDTIDPVINTIGKGKNKKSDEELLALLDGKELGKDEIQKIRITENQMGMRHSGVNPKMNKEMANLFSSKVLLPNEKTMNSSYASQNMVEYKKSQTAIQLNQHDYAAVVKQNYQDKKDKFKLSTMTTHKDICKQVTKEKEKKEKSEENEKEKEMEDDDDEVQIEKPKPKPPNSTLIASNFLKKTFEEIKNTKKKENINLSKTPKLNQGGSSDSAFDLELYIGDSIVTKKLLDVNSKYTNFTPTSASAQKRKLQDSPANKSPNLNSLNDSVEEKKAKKLKMLDDILKIKSNHEKEVNDPEKNPHMKSYFDKLETQEKIDNKLSSIESREVRAVTCSICNYTYFSQSDYCKKLNHSIKRHISIQRFFKCKICNNKMNTLDKLYPISACGQCGNSVFEKCGMKVQDISINKTRGDSTINQASEMYLDCGAD